MNIADLPRVVDYLKRAGFHDAHEDCFVVSLTLFGKKVTVLNWTEAAFLVRMARE